MKEFDEFDKRIDNILKADIYEPKSYTNSIMNALSKKNRRKIISFPKLVAAIIAGAMFISGVVYAKQIGEFIMRVFNENKGTDTAVGYGYVDNINKDFISNSDVKVTLLNFLMDDYNINFVLDIISNEIKKNESLEIPDMLIYDNNLNILYCKDKTAFINFCNKNDLEHDFHIYDEKFINSTIYKNQTYNENYWSYNIKSSKEFPKSKKIFMEFNKIILKNNDENKNELKDNWKIEIDVAEKFCNRTINAYKAVYINEPLITDLKFETYNTGTIIEINAKFTPYITDDTPNENKELMMQEFINQGTKPIFERTNRVDNVFIRNSIGDLFYSSNSNYDDSEIAYSYDGSFHYKTTLDLTQFDMTDELTLYFTIHTIYEDKDVVIKLQKSTE